MNDLILVQELASILAGDGYATLRDAMRPATNPDGSESADPLPPNIFPAQAAANTSRPILVISGEYNNYGTNRMGTVNFELRGRIGDEATGGHQSRFELLWAALFGALGADAGATRANQTAAKLALKMALAGRGAVTVNDYGPAPANAVNADVDGEDLRTVLQVRVAWAFLPSI